MTRSNIAKTPPPRKLRQAKRASQPATSVAAAPTHPDIIVDPKPATRGPGRLRGFAAMDAEKRRLIARKGGASVKPENRSFAKDRKLAVRAGSKGGSASRGGGRKARDREFDQPHHGHDED
jgi:general stress protein YciG